MKKVCACGRPLPRYRLASGRWTQRKLCFECEIKAMKEGSMVGSKLGGRPRKPYSKEYISTLIGLEAWSKKETARYLGVSLSTVYRRLKS